MMTEKQFSAYACLWLLSLAACFFAVVRLYAMTLPAEAHWPVQATAYSWLAGMLTFSLLARAIISIFPNYKVFPDSDKRLMQITAYIWLLGSAVMLVFAVSAAASSKKPFYWLAFWTTFPSALMFGIYRAD